MIFSKNYFVGTTEGIDVISVIHEVVRTVREADVPEGLATVIVPAPGGAVTVIEPLPGIVEHLKEALRIFPGEGLEVKDRGKEEIAVGPRVVAAMIGKSLQIPINDGRLVLGPREEVVLIDLEKEGRRREFFVQVMGEKPAPQQQQAPPRGGMK